MSAAMSAMLNRSLRSMLYLAPSPSLSPSLASTDHGILRAVGRGPLELCGRHRSVRARVVFIARLIVELVVVVSSVVSVGALNVCQLGRPARHVRRSVGSNVAGIDAPTVTS